MYVSLLLLSLCWLLLVSLSAQVDACEAVLADANSPDVIEGIRQLYNKEPIFEMVQLNCALAAIRLEEARLQKDNSLFDRVQEHVDNAKNIRSGEMLPDMMQGMLELAKVSRQAGRQADMCSGRSSGRSQW